MERNTVECHWVTYRLGWLAAVPMHFHQWVFPSSWLDFTAFEVISLGLVWQPYARHLMGVIPCSLYDPFPSSYHSTVRTQMTTFLLVFPHMSRFTQITQSQEGLKQFVTLWTGCELTSRGHGKADSGYCCLTILSESRSQHMYFDWSRKWWWHFQHYSSLIYQSWIYLPCININASLKT